MICPYIVGGIVALLVIMWLADRAAKKKGHQMRDPGEMGRLAKEVRQDGITMEENPWFFTGDASWTAASRHMRGIGERSLRENDELDDPYLKSAPAPDSPVVEED